MDSTTGEIQDREEPDIEAAKGQENFREPVDDARALDIVFETCPISIEQAKKLKVSHRADGSWAVSFGSAYGDFMYVVDADGNLVERNEPDIESAKKEEGFQEDLTAEDAINKAFSVCPIKIPEAKNIKVSLRTDGTWTISFGSEYGDFMYVVDGHSGEILDRIEPDM